MRPNDARPDAGDGAASYGTLLGRRRSGQTLSL